MPLNPSDAQRLRDQLRERLELLDVQRRAATAPRDAESTADAVDDGELYKFATQGLAGIPPAQREHFLARLEADHTAIEAAAELREIFSASRTAGRSGFEFDTSFEGSVSNRLFRDAQARRSGVAVRLAQWSSRFLPVAALLLVGLLVWRVVDPRGVAPVYNQPAISQPRVIEKFRVGRDSAPPPTTQPPFTQPAPRPGLSRYEVRDWAIVGASVATAALAVPVVATMMRGKRRRDEVERTED
jgi:hypothetical protein